MTFPYDLDPDPRPTLGLIALQADETIEDDFRKLIPDEVRLRVSRVPSGQEVTLETLERMADHLRAASALFPEAELSAVGYGCTSGSAAIGPMRVADLVRSGCATKAVTNPLTALSAKCDSLGIRRLAILSPYVERVSDRLRAELSVAGVETPIFGTFAEPSEAKVARIAASSVEAAALTLLDGAEVDALFLSCTNLRTLDVIEALRVQTGLPVLSSNLVLVWHMLRLVGIEADLV